MRLAKKWLSRIKAPPKKPLILCPDSPRKSLSRILYFCTVPTINTEKTPIAMTINNKKKAFNVFETGINKPKPVIKKQLCSWPDKTKVRPSKVKWFRCNSCLLKLNRSTLEWTHFNL